MGPHPDRRTDRRGRARQRCASCGRFQGAGRFDATFRRPDGSERDFFGLPAWVCRPCGQLTFDGELLSLHNLIADRCVSAIGSDATLSRDIVAAA
jgi:hypothetical protein